jgi:lipoprotein-releasing system permease protein
MKYEFFVARRFALAPRGSAAGSHKQRMGKPSFVIMLAMAGVTLGTLSLVLTLAIVKGFSDEIQNKLIGFGSHVVVGSLRGKPLQDSPDARKKITDNPAVAAVSPFVQGQLIIKSKRQSGIGAASNVDGAVLKGIDLQTDVSFIREKIISGKMTLTANEKHLVIGKMLAQRLAVQVGDTVTLVCFNRDAADEKDFSSLVRALSNSAFTIEAVYETGLSQGFDDAIIYASLPVAQTVLSTGTGITGYEVKLRNIDEASQVAGELSSSLGFPYYARSVFEMYQNIFSWLRLQQNIIPVLVVMISVVAAFNILSTLLIIVAERTKEVGIMISFGLGKGRLRNVFLSQAVLVGLAGIALGNGLALVLSIAEKRFGFIPLPQENYYMTHVPITIEPMHYIFVSLAVMAVVLIAALVPSNVAANLKPAEALRF